MNKLYVLCLSFLAFTVLFSLSSKLTFAANCIQLYNGGVTKQQYCFNPTPTPINGNAGQTTTRTQVLPVPVHTKGGQTVYPSTQSKTTPDTGPEVWSLPALFLIGAMGFWLRNKAKT